LLPLTQFSKYGFLDRNRRNKISEQHIGQLNVRTSGVHQLTGRLSGGNQQKVMIAKWLITRPRILIVDEPTKGIDVGAKYELHALLRSLADHGATIVVISSDLPEILGLSDRIVVMHEDRISGELAAEAASEDAIIRCAVGLDSQAAEPTGNHHENGRPLG
jgi:putative multiple sugar transport system ATP-binding protein